MNTNIDLPEEIEKKVSHLATETGRSRNFYLQVILEFLEDLEDASLAEKRLNDLEAGKSRTYSLEEMEKEFGLADKI